MKTSCSLLAAPFHQNKNKGREKNKPKIFFTTNFHSLLSRTNRKSSNQNQTKPKFQEYYYSCKSKLSEMRFFFLGHLHFDIFCICMSIYWFSTALLPHWARNVLWAWMRITSWRMLSPSRPLLYFWQKLQNVLEGKQMLSEDLFKLIKLLLCRNGFYILL